MVHRVSISEDTMERMRKYIRVLHKGADEPGKRGYSLYAYTVEDIVCELLTKEGF
jgi:hypothetical protein